MRAGQILVKDCRDCGATFCGGQGCGPRCGSCYQKWRRAGRPGDVPRPRLKLSDSGYSAAAGVADWRAEAGECLADRSPAAWMIRLGRGRRGPVGLVRAADLAGGDEDR